MGALRKEQVQVRTGEVISLVPILEKKAKKGLNPLQQLQFNAYQARHNWKNSSVGRDTAFVLKGMALTALFGVACACVVGGMNINADPGAAIQAPVNVAIPSR